MDYTAFEGPRRIAAGALLDVVLAVKDVGDSHANGLLIFDPSGRVVDVDLRGTAEDIKARLEPDSAPRGPGRPKLGVVAREVTLLPRHWEWLNAQSGGASVALRKLIDAARNSGGGGDRVRTAREDAYRFMSTMAGNEPGFEEATRALFAGHPARFDEHTAAWPADVRDHARAVAAASFSARP